ncbi:MAG: transposase [Deltaproteobacteria bacterium]|nr:transposase [Deltaproteobacteria bacterium]MBW2399074.1 transposase [Deltaproteobacteria bacterium]
MRSRTPNQQSFDDYRMRGGRGGPRVGAGRKLSGRICDRKKRRERFHGNKPVHVTLRFREGLPRLRNRRLVTELRRSFREACERPDFRLVHYSVQHNHVHLLVEAEDQAALGRGMKSIGARVSRAIQRVFGVTGRVLAQRYHAHVLRTPREVRRALRYVLLNARKHWHERRGPVPPARLDDASSSRWFDGFTRDLPGARAGPREVARPRTWLLARGWRRHGLIDPAAIPGTR